MRTLGLIGGMSWESTLVYYQALNRLARTRLGGQASAKLLIWSDDFAPMAALQAAGEWGRLTEMMIAAARKLEAGGAEALLICANTMHKMADEVARAVSIPLIHIADETAKRLRAAGATRPLLLATRFTMEGGFYLERLAANGVNAVTPGAEERARLHAIIYDELIQGVFSDISRAYLGRVVARARDEQGADAAIFGCTEFGLLATQAQTPLPIFDTALIHAEAGMDFSLS
jgi:aspartate racemase